MLRLMLEAGIAFNLKQRRIFVEAGQCTAASLNTAVFLHHNVAMEDRFDWSSAILIYLDSGSTPVNFLYTISKVPREGL